MEDINKAKVEIKINPEYYALLFPLSDLENEQMKNSLSKDGLHIPIIINSNGEILDGHNRFRICKDLNIPIKYEIKSFKNLEDEKRFVIEVNLNRRHLNDFQKAELAYKLEEIEKEKSRQRKLSKLRNVKNTLSLGSIDHNDDDDNYDKEKGRTIDILSKKAGLKSKTYQRAKTIIQYGSKDVKEKLRQGKSKINKEYEKIDKDRKRQKYLESCLSDNNDINNTLEVKNNYNNNCKVLVGDFRQIAEKEIPDNAIDLIITDPPYADTEENLLLHDYLARLATRVLKPGGSLVTFVGHIIMDKVIEIFNKYSLRNDTGLKYWWIFAVKHSGNHTKVHARHVFAEWKPMLWYVKGKRVNNLAISNTIGDHIESIPSGKTFHKWEQSTIEAEYIIKNLTLENQTVFDPMMGTGTTGIAALKLKRKFIGVEIDDNTFKSTKERIRKFLDDTSK